MNRFVIGIFFCLVFGVTAFAQNPIRLEGQVVCCADCWAKEDRTKVEYGTAEDLLTSQSCIAGGDPTLIAVREGDKFTLYRLELGKYRLPGPNWLEFVGRRIAVTGTVKQSGNAKAVKVDAVEVLATSLAEREATKVKGTEVGLTLKDLFGAEQNLASLKGRIVVLNFWATFCIPCRKEMPDLAAIQNEYAALGVQVIGASTDEAGDRSKVLQFVKDTKINFPIWMGATTGDMIRFGLGAALPGTVIIGRDGRIAHVISGVAKPADLKKQIDALLGSAEQTAAVKEPPGDSPEQPKKVSTVPS